jgi:acetyl esterase
MDMPEKISYWRSQVMGRPVPMAYPKSPAELPGIRERGRGRYDFLLQDLPEIGAIHEGVRMRPDGAARGTPTAEVYVPRGQGPFPVLVQLHGGAWFTGDARDDRKFGVHLAAAGILVVNVNYALAPEEPFPCALEDVVYASRWVARHVGRWGGDPARLGIGGGSAGGNLAAAAALALHGRPGQVDGADLEGQAVRFRALLLQYGLLDLPRWLVEPGYSAGGTEVPIAAYLGPHFTARLQHPLVSPVFSDELRVLPATYLTCGALDVMLSHTFGMASRLVAAGVPTVVSVLEGTDHEFLKIPEKVPGGLEEVQRIVAWLHRHLGPAEAAPGQGA